MSRSRPAISTWTAEFRPELRLAPVAGRPDAGDPAWKPLDQAWRADGREERFQPGWARIRWSAAGLLFDIVFAGRHPRNSARRMNDRTW